MRREHVILRHGRLLAPLHVDDHVIVFALEHEGRWALVAVNNTNESKAVAVALPREAAARFADARDSRITLDVPALFGGVWFSC